MGTFKLGKLKLKYDPETRGISYKWGDGEVKRIGGKKEPEYEEDYTDSYAEGSAPDDGNEYYDENGDGYAPDDSYADDGYYDADDGYDPNVDEDGYSDRYADSDADDRYAAEYPDEGGSSIMRYIDENPWVMYVLLIVFPPVGIWLLWRSGSYEQPMRIGISAASLVWFIVVLVLIITAVSGGTGDVKNESYILTTPGPVVTIAPVVTVDPSATLSADATAATTPGSIDLNANGSGSAPAATPNTSGGGNTGGSNTGDSSGYVYATTSGRFYHSNETCQLLSGQTPSKVTVTVCKNRGQFECPYCYNKTVYYATPGGKQYHTNATCSEMKNAEVYTEEAAVAEGKTACTVCAGGKSTQDYANSVTVDKSGITVYATKGGKYFHVYSDCSDMKNASAVTLLAALKAGKTACPTCCAQAGKKVYCTEGGTYYHSFATCSDMKNASSVTLAAALVLGKKACPECIKSSSGGGSTSTDGVYVYATEGGKYYHTNATCSDMKNAVRGPLKKMVQLGREACPVCCKGANNTVYCVEGGTYYHSYATCSDMKNAQKGTLAQALAYGYKKCPKCWTTSDDGETVPEESGSSKSGIKVYATKTSKYYHTNSTCSGMENPYYVTLETAVAAGKGACPKCASVASRTVYAVSGGKYYHYDSTCSDMKNPKSGTLAQALMAGYTKCPKCGSNADSGTNSGKYTVGTSGIKVYAVKSGKYYHLESSCAGSEAVQVTLETALNYGMGNCPKCAADTNRTVYAVSGGKYYHYSQSCAGDGAKKGTLDDALAYGYKACPYCVTKTAVSDDGYKVGTSGIKVYANKGGKYFHKDQTCAGTEASLVALETALNYGITTGCPKCAQEANETVYVAPGGKYFHYSKTCAGSGAASGTLAKALALGLKECPICGNQDETPPDDEEEGGTSSGGAASGSTTVYINTSDDGAFLYHKNKSCTSGATTGVTLDFALDFGYEACSKCNPPTSVE